MTASVQESTYKDQPSWVLENPTLRAEFIAHGGRMVSLRHKKRNHEFLYEQQSATYVRGLYGHPMAPDQSAGYDDMFPTIIECHYEEFPWKGTLLPDHGEAWALDWEIAAEADALTLSCYGVRLPYKLSRRVTLPAENQLRMDYALENLSPFEMAYLWSAHPLFRSEEGATIILPEECRRAWTALSTSGRLGGYGEEFNWPHWTDADGNKYELNRLRSPGAGELGKYFFKNKVVSGWCALKSPSAGLTLRLAFPPEKVPYLAVVVGEKRPEDPRSYVMLEPCSAPFDRLDISRSYTRQSTVVPKATNTWFLTFSVDGG